MGAAASSCSNTVRTSTACEVVEGVCPRPRLQKYRNRRACGMGGKLNIPQGHVASLVVAFDYEGYPAEDVAGCGPLSCVADGRRFADLAGASRAEVREFYDQPMVPGNLGFPRKERILEEMRTLGNSLGPNDVFVFYFGGHGKQLQDSSDNGDAEINEQLCFVEPDGTLNCLSASELSAILVQEFRADTHIFLVTDCCNAGTLCDLARQELNGRPICYISAVRNYTCIEDLAASGSFTCSLLQTVSQFVRSGDKEFSVIEVFNACFTCHELQDTQDLRFERTHDLDPDTFAWPLVPMRGWQVREAADLDICAEKDVAKQCGSLQEVCVTSTLQELGKLDMKYKQLQAASALLEADMRIPSALGMPPPAMVWPRRYGVGGA